MSEATKNPEKSMASEKHTWNWRPGQKRRLGSQQYRRWLTEPIIHNHTMYGTKTQDAKDSTFFNKPLALQEKNQTLSTGTHDASIRAELSGIWRPNRSKNRCPNSLFQNRSRPNEASPLGLEIPGGDIKIFPSKDQRNSWKTSFDNWDLNFTIGEIPIAFNLA